LKKIEAFIRPEQLGNIKETLGVMNISGLSISQVNGFGKQKGWKEFVRGTTVEYNFLPKLKLEIVILDGQVEELVDRICQAAYTGETGDGKIFVYDVQDAVRIRTREHGEAAVK
jgi:nitrogen regulatory protein P-II 1